MTLVSVVVPYFNQPEQLALMVDALERQSWPLDRLELVIADDGSLRRPRLSTRLRHTVVWQPDRGFRAAAARNLGARAASGEVICFLDCDTIPDPQYVERAVAPVLDDPATLVVGKRRHRHLTGPQGGTWLSDPQWLLDGYAATGDLRDADDTGYRFVISAVLTMSRRLLEITGGFDEGFTQYGGEDWELGWRAWLSGALLRHVPDAVAVHDGPDFTERTVDPAVKNIESMHLARLIAHPSARPGGVRYRRPEVLADLRGLGAGADVVEAAAALLRHGDVSVVLDEAPEALREDPRVLTEMEHDLQRGARTRLRLHAPVTVEPALLRELMELAAAGAAIEVDGGTGVVARCESTRAINRRELWGAEGQVRRVERALPLLDPAARLEARWAGWEA